MSDLGKDYRDRMQGRTDLTPEDEAAIKRLLHPPLTKAWFAEQRCGLCGGGDPSCAHDTKLYLHATCHPAAPPWIYHSDGLLHIECSVCKKPGPTIQLG